MCDTRSPGILFFGTSDPRLADVRPGDTPFTAGEAPAGLLSLSDHPDGAALAASLNGDTRMRNGLAVGIPVVIEVAVPDARFVLDATDDTGERLFSAPPASAVVRAAYGVMFRQDDDMILAELGSRFA